MKRMPFEALHRSMEFQQLCADLLRAEGCKNVRGLGTGPDQGSDIVVEIPISSPLSVDIERFIVQCKWYSPNASVGQDQVVADFEYLDLHNATGLLFITSSQFSGTAITKMNAIDSSTRNPYHIKYWDGYELTRRLRKHPELIIRYWYPTYTSGGQHNLEQLPVYDEQALTRQFAMSLPEFASITLDAFPIAPGNEQFVESLKDYASKFTEHPPEISVVEGAIGSGKTGYCWSLLNQKVSEGFKIAELQPFDFAMMFYEFVLQGRDYFLTVLKFFQEVDYLLIDNIEHSGLRDKSDTQIQAAKTLVNLIQERIAAKKPTLLSTVAVERLPEGTIRNYLQHLKGRYPVIYTGDVSLRPFMSPKPIYARESSEGPSEKAFIREKLIIAEICVLLSKSVTIESRLDRVTDLLLTPEDEDEAARQRWKEVTGEYQSRIDEVSEILGDAKGRLDELLTTVLSYFPEDMVETAKSLEKLSSLRGAA